MHVLQLLKLTSVPDAVAAAGAAQSSSAPPAQYRQHPSHRHPAKRKREADDDDDLQAAGSAPLADRHRDSAAAAAGAAAMEQDVKSEPSSGKASQAADAPYSGVDTAELATVVPWASRRFVWDTLQLQLQVCCTRPGVHTPAVNYFSTSLMYSWIFIADSCSMSTMNAGPAGHCAGSCAIKSGRNHVNRFTGI